MKSVNGKVLEDGAKALTATSGIGTSAGSMLGFLNGNAPALGLLLTLIFGCISVYYQHKRNQKLDEKHDAEREIARLQAKLKQMQDRE